MDTYRQLQLYNSLGRRVEDFVPSGDVVGMYSCGPTVYAFPHLGNMRAYVFADTLRRALRWKGHEVRHVVNITDVGHAVAETELGEDKVEAAAARERLSVDELAAFYTRAFFDDLAALSILPAHEYPRATAYVEDMVEFARVLEAEDFTYTIPSGLYFDTSRSSDYGALALMDAEGQREGARLEQVEGRKNKTDFALWRTEDPHRPRVMRWKSPWGWGAPGWHLECSVMSVALLGRHFDIHTGGIDHRELHHVNEIAQSEAFLGDGRPWVRYWLHNEFLRFKERKMAKSAGTATRLADLMTAGIHPLTYRLFLLGGHYRNQMDFAPEAIEATQASLCRVVNRVASLRPLPPIQTLEQADALLPTNAARARRLLSDIDAGIATDLNTPLVLAVLHQTLREPELADDSRRILIAACNALLGLRLDAPLDLELKRQRDIDSDEREAIERLVAERAAARANRDWQRADRVRRQLTERGVVLTDTPAGTEWTVE